MLGDEVQLSVAVAVELGNSAIPFEFNVNVTLLAEIVGAVASTTVTDFVAVLTLPEASVAVIVTVLLPRSEHPNVLGVIVTVGALVQLSEVLLTTSDDVIVAAPLASNVTLTAPEIVVMLGAVLSTTVTDLVAVVAFPAPSVAVMVTVLLPISSQSNVLGETDTVSVEEQLSVVALITSDEVIVAAPLASKAIVTVPLSVVIVGAVLS